MNKAQAIMRQVAGLLDEAEVGYERFAEGRALKSGIRGSNAHCEVIIAAQAEPPLLRVEVHLPLQVSEAKRRDVAELVVRINQPLPLGRFDAEMKDGDLRFYASIPLIDTTLSADLFHATLATALHKTDRYQRAFGRLLLDDDSTPALAVAEVDMARNNGFGS